MQGWVRVEKVAESSKYSVVEDSIATVKIKVEALKNGKSEKEEVD